MKQAITSVNGHSTSIVTTKEELLKEVNHYQAFWLSSVGTTYSNTGGNIQIKVDGLTREDRLWISNRMR